MVIDDIGKLVKFYDFLEVYDISNVCFQLTAEMLKSSPPPSKRLSQYAPLIHIMKVCPLPISIC